MSANTDTDETEIDIPEEYHPAKNLSPVEVSRAFATLSSEGVNVFNQSETRTDGTVDDADRVLVSLDAELAERIHHRAWEFNRDPGILIDAFVKHGDLAYEDATEVRQQEE